MIVVWNSCWFIVMKCRCANDVHGLVVKGNEKGAGVKNHCFAYWAFGLSLMFCLVSNPNGRSFQIFLMALPGGASSFRTLIPREPRRQLKSLWSCKTHQNCHRSGRCISCSLCFSFLLTPLWLFCPSVIFYCRHQLHYWPSSLMGIVIVDCINTT